MTRVDQDLEEQILFLVRNLVLIEVVEIVSDLIEILVVVDQREEGDRLFFTAPIPQPKNRSQLKRVGFFYK
ncbi:MAG: hypothetical protein ACJAXB_002928 [Candidatus Endobugula sp.]|jgi:hypothetical protein